MDPLSIVTFLTNLTTINVIKTIETFDSYVFRSDSNRQNNPDVDLPTLDMITRQGYPAEAHVVTTEDGYILTIHRIPGGPFSTPVFLQHGLLGSSADWVIPGKQRGLPYLLADQGYDVWLGNVRGNTYSRAHKTLSTDDSRFWNFSFHEMGVYDLPAVLSYITDMRQSTLIYVGHSMGTTMSYIMASERPDIGKRVRMMISLAPIGFMSHLKSPLRLIAPFANDIWWITQLVGYDEFLPRTIFTKMLARYGCDLITVERDICENILFSICGYDPEQFNKTLLPVIFGHEPSGASTKTLVHYAQEIQSGYFRNYDYGEHKNRIIYNRADPPPYDLSKVQIPTAFFYSDNDWLASPVDVEALWKKLPTKVDMTRVNFTKFNHLDFLWGIDAPILVYDKLISIVDNYRSR